MAQFLNILDVTHAYLTIQQNGTSLPQETIINFIGTQFTIADDPTNTRTNITYPNFVLISGSTMTGPLILNGDPTVALQAATKQYVDSISAGLSPRTSCRAASTTTLTVTYNNGSSGVGATLTNAGTQAALVVDGITLSVNDRILIKDQSTQAQNGIYTVTNIGSNSTNWILTRSTDFDHAAANGVIEGAYTIISEGTVNATNLYVETGQGPFTIGTTAIVFTAMNSAANINVTTPLTKTGNTIALTTPLAPQYGGTGINNGANTITLGGNILTANSLTTVGNNTLTLTTTGNTNVTFPTTGSLVNTAVTTLSSLVSIGTITTGTWNGSLITGIYGGTGVNNGTNTITLGGSLTTSGAFASTFTMTNTTNVTFPTSGTLATTSQIPSLPISLVNGGTNANLTASNGGIFYSTASAGAILAGTVTANQILLSGSTAAPSWSTATYPSTTTINQILYSSAANTITELTTANSGVLITSAGGVPSISATLPSAVQGNITSTGTIVSGTWHGSVISEIYGGTNQSSYTVGDILYASNVNTLAKLAKNTTATRYLANTGTSNIPAWDQINLSNGVTSTLDISNGGTGVTSCNPVIQRVSTMSSAVATGTTIMPDDDTIPQNTEGDQYMSLSITPKNTANILIIEHIGVYSSSIAGTPDITVALFQDTTANALAGIIDIAPVATGQNVKVLRYIMTAGTTSSTTFNIRAGGYVAGTTTFNGSGGGRRLGGVMASSLMITEYSS